MGRRNVLRPAAGDSGDGESEHPGGVSLHYIGDGAALAGVPARDIAAEELANGTYNGVKLVQSGLYAIRLEANDESATNQEAH